MDEPKEYLLLTNRSGNTDKQIFFKNINLTVKWESDVKILKVNNKAYLAFNFLRLSWFSLQRLVYLAEKSSAI